MVFHMNLAFSAITAGNRPKVIARCYHPLLDLAEHSEIPIGIEASGWTLEEIERLDPAWITRFRTLLEQGKCELIGSGYMQLIGPLVPAKVNEFNQEEGLQVYKDLLAVKPRLALVNEMAFSSGLVPFYEEAGYKALIMERENLGRSVGEDLNGPLEVVDPEGKVHMPLLPADAILFQKFQRYIHREIPKSNLMDWLARRTKEMTDPLALYCSDVEIFNNRPKRYDYEDDEGRDDEWRRIADLVKELSTDYRIVRPSKAVKTLHKDERAKPVRVRSAWYPIPVKKQPKYNLARWAVTGRDDLMLNTACYRMLKQMEKGRESRRLLLRSWSSDLRTHIDNRRLSETLADLAIALEGYSGPSAPTMRPKIGQEPEAMGIKIKMDDDDFGMHLKTKHMRLSLNRRRGLAIEKLSFADHDFEPVVGTLPHGYFRAIDLGADFYSGGITIETTDPVRRITDLERVRPHMGWLAGWFAVQGRIETALGTITKTLSIHPTKALLRINYDFSGWERPMGTVRVGNITLIPEGFGKKLFVRTRNGGRDDERFVLDRTIKHNAAVSSLVSCTSGLGATDGKLALGCKQRSVVMQWDQTQCAAFPMLQHEPAEPGHLTRIIFSLAEIDDTRKPGGQIPGLSLTLKPGKGL